MSSLPPLSGFAPLKPLPADPLLGLMAAYRADPRPEKIDLGVGVYRDETGITPIMDAVARAEAQLARTNTTKVYEGPRGNIEFCQHIEQSIFSSAHGEVSDQLVSCATPGGTGGLYLGFGLVARAGQASDRSPTVWVSDPTWPNHHKVVSAVGLSAQTYRYYTPATGQADAQAMMDDLQHAAPGDGVLVQGACHNPTGADLPLSAWEQLGDLCAERDLIPLIDIAYHGLAAGLEEDMAGPRALLARAPQAIVSYSCSKNFGLYRDRAGALVVKANSPDAVPAITSHAADLARTAYSMPPAHGPALVATILDDPDLAQAWREELSAMRNRVKDLRASVVAALQQATGSDQFAAVQDQNGMFSMLALPDGAPARLRDAFGIYVPNSGRINIAGLRGEQPHIFAQAVAQVCADAPQEPAQ